MLERIAAIAQKEARHIVRDPRTLTIVMLMPVIMMFLYGYALTTDVQDLPVAVEMQSPGGAARSIVRALDASTLFEVTMTAPVVSDPRAFMTRHRVRALLRFQRGFDADLQSEGGGAVIQVLIDGSDPNTGTIIRNAIEPIIMKAVAKYLVIEIPNVVSIQQRVLYNPQQKSAFYFVPGLMVVLLTMMSAMLTSIALAREKETGTLSQLLISPLRAGEIVIGKLLPYLVISAIDGAMVLIVGRLWFDVRVAGSLTLLALSSLLYIFVYLSLGLLISAVTGKQLHAMLVALVVTMLPTVMLTGFIFPVASMPLPLRIVSRVIPATYYLDVVRGIILKGSGVDVLWRQLLVLGGMGLVLMTISVKRFKASL